MLEEISPLESTELVTGDFSQSFNLPASPKNRKIFNFVDQIQLADKVIRYDDVVIVDQYFGTIRGTILTQETITDFGGGSIDADFFTNLLQIDVFNEKLANVLGASAKFDLGVSTAAIIASAKAQNAAQLSQDGTSGAVMKFIPHFNPEFFSKEVNPDWNLESSDYDSTQAYAVDDVVIYQTRSAFDQPEKYICISAAAISETPITHPNKWQKIPFCVLNDWDTDADTFYTNETQKIGNKYFQNFHALVPWMQLHHIIRSAANGIGYTVDGDYMKDTHEQRALIESNFAQVRPAEYRALLQVNNFSDENALALPQNGGPTGTGVESIVQDPPSENDPLGLFDEDDQEFTINRKGVYIIRCTGFIWADENGVDEVQLFFFLLESGVNIAASSQTFAVGSFPDGSTTQEFEIEIVHEYDYVGTDGTVDQVLELRAEVQDTDSLGAVLTNTFISFENITYQGVDNYDGGVHFSDHVPDITVADFFEAIRTWKNVLIDFDGRKKVISLNYIDPIIKQRKDVLNLDPYKTGAERIKHKPKKRFKLNYGVLPENTQSAFSGFQTLEPLDKIQDLNGYILNNDIAPTSKKAVLIKSLNAWLLTGASKYSDKTVWTLFSQNWPDLQIEETGDLYEIAPQLGPVSMGYFKAFSGDLFTAPITFGQGRSSGQPQEGEAPPFRVAYWLGIDTSTVDGGYPLATTTANRSDGANFLNISMSWLDQYENFWIRTLKMIVQEEIIVRSFLLPPHINEKIKWQTIALLGSTPNLIIKKLRAIGTEQIQQLELRRIKQSEITVVNETTIVDENNENEIQLPSESDLSLWLDSNDESSYPGAGNIWYDISGNNNDFSLYNNPALNSDGSGSYLSFNGSTHYAERSDSLQDSGNFEVIVVLKKPSTIGFEGIIEWAFLSTQRTGAALDGNVLISSGGAQFRRFSPSVSINDWTMLNITGANGAQANKNAFENLSTKSTVNTATLSATTESPITRIGDLSVNSPFRFEGDIALLIVYNKILSSLDRQQIYDIYQPRFGLS